MDYKESLTQNNEKIQDIIDVANSLPDAGGGGIDTSDATATADDIMAGKTAYVNGELITGEFSLDSELEVQGQLISGIQTAIDELDNSDNTEIETIEPITLSITCEPRDFDINYFVFYTSIYGNYMVKESASDGFISILDIMPGSIIVIDSVKHQFKQSNDTDISMGTALGNTFYWGDYNSEYMSTICFGIDKNTTQKNCSLVLNIQQ